MAFEDFELAKAMNDTEPMRGCFLRLHHREEILVAVVTRHGFIERHVVWENTLHDGSRYRLATESDRHSKRVVRKYCSFVINLKSAELFVFEWGVHLWRQLIKLSKAKRIADTSIRITRIGFGKETLYWLTDGDALTPEQAELVKQCSPCSLDEFYGFLDSARFVVDDEVPF